MIRWRGERMTVQPADSREGKSRYLPGWPSFTLSEVKMKCFSPVAAILIEERTETMTCLLSALQELTQEIHE